jgi:hypothetical protein
VGLLQGRENRDSLSGAALAHVTVAQQRCDLNIAGLALVQRA